MKYLLFLLPFPALAFDYTGVIDARYQEALIYVGAAIAAVVALAILTFGVSALRKWLDNSSTGPRYYGLAKGEYSNKNSYRSRWR